MVVPRPIQIPVEDFGAWFVVMKLPLQFSETVGGAHHSHRQFLERAKCRSRFVSVKVSHRLQVLTDCCLANGKLVCRERFTSRRVRELKVRWAEPQIAPQELAKSEIFSTSPDSQQAVTEVMLKNATLLIAEDDAPLAESYRRHFVRIGYRVLIASDGAECLRVLRSESPVALVVSMELPGDAGRSIVDCLREESCRRSVPSVVLTGWDPFDRIANWTDPFFVRYFTKPVAMKELSECVRLAQSLLSDWRTCRVGQTFE